MPSGNAHVLIIDKVEFEIMLRVTDTGVLEKKKCNILFASLYNHFVMLWRVKILLEIVNSCEKPQICKCDNIKKSRNNVKGLAWLSDAF